MANHGREYSGVEEEAMAGRGPSPRGFNPWDARTETILVASNPAARSLAAGAKAAAVAGVRKSLRAPVTDELPGPRPDGPPAASGRAAEFLAEGAAFPPYAAVPGEDPEGMDQVMEYLRAHYRENVPMKVLADLVRLSLRQFHRNFKKRYGMPPNQFLIRMRVLAARDMLVSDKRPVAKIAYDLGFADDTLFIRQFKARMGMTPLQYRKAYR
jgi:AraC-like DNA-binding protein